MQDTIHDIILYMHQHANMGVNIEHIADNFGYSKFHFSREFKKITGLKPTEYLASIKIDKSISTIIQGDSVINAQLDAGYESAGTFTNTFSKMTGISPRTYGKEAELLFGLTKKQEVVKEDNDNLFFRNPNYPTVVAPYKLTVNIEVPKDFKGIVFSGLFFKPNPNHQPLMGRCRVKVFTYDFYHLPPGIYYPLACGIKRSSNPFHYFKLKEAMRACDGQSVIFPLKKNETISIKLRQYEVTDPPVVINLPNLLSQAIQQQIKRNTKKVKKKLNIIAN